MSRTASAREPQQCRDKEALIDQIRASINLIDSIHNEEMKAVLSADFSAGESMERRLLDAGELKGLLIDLFRRHITEHGC